MKKISNTDIRLKILQLREERDKLKAIVKQLKDKLAEAKKGENV